ncbi:IMP1 inner mitochondrial membrane peptidase-like, partial [Cichlidogyrus casuarinus]
VPKDHVWLEGDNKKISQDSRTYGSVPLEQVHYKAFLRIWPLHKICWLNKLPPPFPLSGSSSPMLEANNNLIPAISCEDHKD